MPGNGVANLYLKHDYTASDYMPLSPNYMAIPATRYEPLKYYSRGGYCPVHLHDIIRSRYLIINKLGFGTSSTVWLAHDLHRDRLCALKILKARTQIADSERELDILRNLRRKRHRDFPWLWNAIAGQEAYRAARRKPMSLILLDEFVIESPNGPHVVIVTECLAWSLHKVLRHVENFKLTPKLVIRMIISLARAAASMHQKKIAHGDIHPGNVMFALHDTKQIPNERIKELFGKPDLVKVKDIDPELYHRLGVPRYLVPTAPLTPAQLALLPYCTVKFIDYGEAHQQFDLTEHRYLPHLPHNIAPEVAFREPITPKTDIWALGCLFFEIIAGYPPFIGWTLDDYLADAQRAFLEPLPLDYWNRWEKRKQYFSDRGEWICKIPDGSGPTGDLKFGQRLRNSKVCNFGKGYWEEHEYEVLEKLLRAMLQFEPRKRISAEEIVGFLPDCWRREAGPLRKRKEEFTFFREKVERVEGDGCD